MVEKTKKFQVTPCHVSHFFQATNQPVDAKNQTKISSAAMPLSLYFYGENKFNSVIQCRKKDMSPIGHAIRNPKSTKCPVYDAMMMIHHSCPNIRNIII